MSDEKSVDTTDAANASARTDGGCKCSCGCADATPSPAGTNGTPGAEVAGGDNGGRKQDILTPSPAEARELERFIDTGHRSPHTVTLLSFLGIVILLAGLLYWDKLDLYPYQAATERQWQPFGGEVLPMLVKTQHLKEAKAYRLQPGVETAPPDPYWPAVMYGKLRADIFIVAGLALLLGWVMLRIERAKARRNDLLAFRALAREIEKLRLRIRELEKNPGDKE